MNGQNTLCYIARRVLWWFVIQQKWLKQEENREAPFSQASVMETKDVLLKSCLSRNFISGDTIPQVPQLIPVLRIRDFIGSCVCAARVSVRKDGAVLPPSSPSSSTVHRSWVLIKVFKTLKKMYRECSTAKGSLLCWPHQAFSIYTRTHYIP